MALVGRKKREVGFFSLFFFISSFLHFFFNNSTRGKRDKRNDACHVTAFLFSEGKGLHRARVSQRVMRGP